VAASKTFLRKPCAEAQGQANDKPLARRFMPTGSAPSFLTEIHNRLSRLCLHRGVDFDTSKMIWILCAVVLVIGGATLAYREHLGSNANWITKILSEDMPVITGKYRKCLERYAPVAAGSHSSGS
jgi:hypothetical protein